MERCYATEKIHGTSAHVKWTKKDGFEYFPGGVKLSNFTEMLAERIPDLEQRVLIAIACTKRSDITEVIFFGEAYGGKCQKMSNVYGPLNFIVFEVKVNDEWQNVPQAAGWARLAGIEFVDWVEGPATVEFLNEQRDKPSTQARLNGMGEHIGEGIVVRPINEADRDRFGERLLAKHKRAEFCETKTPREVDPEKQRQWSEAKETAEEFVVPMRLQHVVDKLVATKPGFEFTMKNTRTVIGAMIADVRKEEGDTITWSKPIQSAIGNRAAKLWRELLEERLNGGDS
jgi:hypothetical protein